MMMTLRFVMAPSFLTFQHFIHDSKKRRVVGAQPKRQGPSRRESVQEVINLSPVEEGQPD